MRRTFPRSARVIRRQDFDVAFASGRRAGSDAMLVVARENGLGWSRLGLSTGRRFGRAHQRNRAKRLLREAFRLEREQLPVGYDFIVVPRAGAFPDHADDARRVLVELAGRAIRGRQNQPRLKDGRKRRR